MQHNKYLSAFKKYYININLNIEKKLQIYHIAKFVTKSALKKKRKKKLVANLVANLVTKLIEKFIAKPLNIH